MEIIFDTSSIDGSYSQFLELVKDSVLILTDRVFEELEERKIDKSCSEKNKIFAKRVIKYVGESLIRGDGKAKIVKLGNDGIYTDKLVAEYAASTGATVYTGDYGMVIACYFKKVDVIFAEHIRRERLDFVIDGVMDLQLIPRGESIFAISKDGEKKKSWDYQVKLYEGDKLLRAMEDPDTGSWTLVEYEVLPGRVISKSRERSDGDGHEPFSRYDQELIDKWIERRQKNF